MQTQTILPFATTSYNIGGNLALYNEAFVSIIVCNSLASASSGTISLTSNMNAGGSITLGGGGSPFTDMQSLEIHTNSLISGSITLNEDLLSANPGTLNIGNPSFQYNNVFSNFVNCNAINTACS